MKIGNRIIILVIIVVGFLVAVPISIYYAAGYTFDFGQKRFVKTGILVVNTNPRNSEIFLDGENKDQSPARLRFLKPGQYNLEIKKQGYKPWKKSITVAPQQITHLNAKDKEVSLFFVKPRKSLIATSTQKLLSRPEQFSYLRPTSTPASEIFMLENPSAPFAISADNLYQIVTDKATLLQENIDEAYWVKKANLLVYSNPNNIWIFNPDEGKKSELITRSQEAILSPQFNEETGQMFFLQDGKIKAIEVYSLFEKNIIEILSEEPPITDYTTNEDGEIITYLLDNGELWEAEIR